ncbi:oligopeptide transporter, OPT family [Helcobacillus massiliensis]|uniref:OPT family oligopeptide transporter n=1 Tax=Helcobacillus massiliensis TaxID=521392 RepID=UPI0021A84F5D|nr:oligopeptide transporter, OPT family [Helcobacillus massiliensis]MCT1557850.1 oligopeptide transporter, OPT family [Helcobacillus massiliensis]MCT2036654.1 oligopeptide transporter, OPT family [Helcobacillus massiliensis]MCT2332125.1 oligopeptide transporter, OPT family [Helcobacillus massiliensis]
MSSTPTTAASGRRQASVRELTLRGVVLGGLITLIFTAANVYLGLKVGLTFATSIPAAVISMAVLRFFSHTIQENNIVQTIASAAGTLSAIIFVLPGLVIVGWWAGFPYWTTALVCAVGGILGVTYSIPLRRTLVTGSDLPYPEGVAAAEVLKVGDSAGSSEENKRGLHVIIAGALGAAAFSLFANLKVLASSVGTALRLGSGGTMVGGSLSLALIGVGHLVGITVGIAMIIGMIISYGILLPTLTQGQIPADADLMETVGGIFGSDVRFIGAGTIAVAAVWTLLKLIVPIVRGISEALASNRRRRGGGEVDITERDIPMSLVLGITLLSMIPIGLLLWSFLKDTAISHHTGSLIAVAVVFTLLIGLVVASVCGYMAGLIGASNSPISGVGILVAIAAALVVKLVHGTSGADTASLVAFTLFTAAIVFGIGTISNDNLQDLKTGQLVGATPWKQQVALIIGVIFGSIIIPPVLQLMHTAFGFAGDPNAGPDALAAPQASLISSLVKGVLGGDLNWGLIGIGALIGAVVIVIDEALRAASKGKKRALALPPLAVGMGMYLPMELTLIIPIGALIGLVYNRWASTSKRPEVMKRLGILLATGLIVGESLFGVVFAGVVAASGEAEPLAIVGESFQSVAMILGVLAFAGIIAVLYRWVMGLQKTLPAADETAEPTGRRAAR